MRRVVLERTAFPSCIADKQQILQCLTKPDTVLIKCGQGIFYMHKLPYSSKADLNSLQTSSRLPICTAYSSVPIGVECEPLVGIWGRL